jgi:hypothetical protein
LQHSVFAEALQVLIKIKVRVRMAELGEARVRQQVTAKMFASKFRSKREV